MTTLDLTGLATRPAQLWGAVRLVPLVRDEPYEDLRLRPEAYGDAADVVADAPHYAHFHYAPHGFVATWTKDGTPAAVYGTQLSTHGEATPPAAVNLHLPVRTVQRQGKHQVRFLSQHLALGGYLMLHFNGPPIGWKEWSRGVIRHGLVPPVETAVSGLTVRGLADALRIFEIHPGQCGVLVYVADVLAAAFVVPHPDDYRVLHSTLLHDLYGELIYHYATLMPPVRDFTARVADARIRTLADLRTAVVEQENAWARFHDTTMAAGLLEGVYTWRPCYQMGGFTLSRFLPPFRTKEENHIGEAITDERGRIAYLKSFRLSEIQVRRGHLLSKLAANDWHPANTAAELSVTEAQLGLRLESAGFGFLLRQDILDGYRKQARNRTG